MAQPSVVIVNPFDPLPGEERRDGRYAHLVRRLAQRGCRVTWISSDWSHRHKRRRDVQALRASAESAGVRVELVPTAAYAGNVGLRRLRSHARLAADASRRLESLGPDMVVVSTPPPVLAANAVAEAHRLGAWAVVDVQDLWPSEFARLLPRGLKWLNHVLFRSMEDDYARACRQADARVAVAKAYLADAQRFGAGPRDRVVHLGADVAEFDRDAASGRNLTASDTQGGRPVLFLGGTIGVEQDWRTAIEAVRLLAKNELPAVLAVFGTGPEEPRLKAVCAGAEFADRVRFFGWREHDDFAATLKRATVAVNSWAPGSTVAFPNRAFDYLAAGLPMVSSLGGEFSTLVETEGIGLNYEAGSADELANALRRLLADPSARAAMGRSARRLAVERFDRAIEYGPYVDLCERLASDAGASCDSNGFRCGRGQGR